jgi:hypothetical protein
MQMLYNSDHFVVVAFDLSGEGQAAAADSTPAAGAVDAAAPQQSGSGGYEIVDKLTRKEIFIQGAVAASFRQGVQALVDQGPDPEALDDYIGSFTTLAQQPLLVH